MESRIAIRVENLGKCFRIGQSVQMHESFVAMVMSWAKSPMANFRALRSLTHFEDSDDAKDNSNSSNDIIWALRDVSFEVRKGETLGIIGRNGTGKSTLLKILSRITELSTGRVEIHGRVASLIEVGTGFHPELTGRDNVYFNGTILGMSKSEIDAKFDEIVDFSGVEKFIDTPVKRYSSGMRLRLAFSVAAHLRTEIMLVDEVLAVGDAAFQRKCIDKMATLANDGCTVLLVSHNMAVVNRLCNSGIVLHGGKVHFSGSSSSAISAYERLSANVSEGVFSHSDCGVAIHSVRMEGFDGVLTPGTPLTFLVDVDVRKRFFNLSLVFGLETVDGQGLILDVVDSDQIPALLNPGRHSVRISLPSLWLRPRTYTVRIKIVVHPMNGTTQRFQAEPLDIVVDGSEITGLSDWVLQPNINWVLSSSKELGME